ncbi:MAG: PrsW family intramembrane metalloprotease [Proteobacteria bacterium]|nr:PrsW family intramembrane metalloprotease [Pseudomonadota bacterium]
MIVLASIVGFLPGIFWLYYFYKKDVIEPEPRSLIIKTYLVGILVAVPVVVVEMKLPFGSDTMTMAVGGAPVVEELFKLLAVYWFVYRHKEFDEPMDGIVYAASLALGFASIENVAYLFRALQSGDFKLVFSLRALLSVPGHALFSSIWGYGLGLVKFGKISRITLVATILGGIVCHALFNLMAALSLGFGAALIGFSLVLWAVFHKNTEHALVISPHRKYSKYVKSQPPEQNDEESG